MARGKKNQWRSAAGQVFDMCDMADRHLLNVSDLLTRFIRINGESSMRESLLTDMIENNEHYYDEAIATPSRQSLAHAKGKLMQIDNEIAKRKRKGGWFENEIPY